MLKKAIVLSAVACLAAFGGMAQASVRVDWNDPAKGADGWVYFSSSNDVPTIQWAAAGGQDGGYIVSDLSLLGDWGRWANSRDFGYVFAEEDYYPAYGFELSAIRPGVERTLTVAIRDQSTQDRPLNLAGGQLQFWIGDEWNDTQQAWFTYYAFATPLNPGLGTWTDNTLRLTADPADWLLIGDNQGKSLADLLGGPVVEYGFRIIGGTAAPQGILGFDNFALVPEPASLVLLGLGLGAIVLVRRSRIGGASGLSRHPCG